MGTKLMTDVSCSPQRFIADVDIAVYISSSSGIFEDLCTNIWRR
jgi:hypothetical protein